MTDNAKEKDFHRNIAPLVAHCNPLNPDGAIFLTGYTFSPMISCAMAAKRKNRRRVKVYEVQ